MTFLAKCMPATFDSLSEARDTLRKGYIQWCERFADQGIEIEAGSDDELLGDLASSDLDTDAAAAVEVSQAFGEAADIIEEKDLVNKRLRVYRHFRRSPLMCFLRINSSGNQMQI